MAVAVAFRTFTRTCFSAVDRREKMRNRPGESRSRLDERPYKIRSENWKNTRGCMYLEIDATKGKLGPIIIKISSMTRRRRRRRYYSLETGRFNRVVKQLDMRRVTLITVISKHLYCLVTLLQSPLHEHERPADFNLEKK